MLNINFDVWSEPTLWKYVSNYNILLNAYNITVPTNPQPRTWNDMIDNGKQPKNADLDFSCAPWRINGKSVLLNGTGCYWKTIGNDQKTAIPNPFNVLRVREHCPFILQYKSSGLSRAIRPYNAYIYKDTPITGSAHVSANNIAINFKYDEIVLTPVIRYIQQPYDLTSWGTSITYVCKNLDEFDPSDAAAIVNIGFRVWYKNSNTNQYVQMPLAPMLNYDFSGDDITFEMTGNIPYFAGQSGMKQFSTPYTNSGTSWGGVNTFWLYDFSENYSMSTFTASKSDDYCKSYRYCIPRSNTNREIRILLNQGDGWRLNQGTQNATTTFPSMIYYTGTLQDLYAQIRRELAYIGLPFTMLEANVGVKHVGDEGFYLPVFDDNRTTTGDYNDGADALQLINSTWEWIYDLPALPDIDPVIPDTPSIPVNDTGDRGNRQNIFPKFSYPNAVYALTKTQFLAFINDVNGLYLSNPDDTQLKLDFKGSNPNDYIIGCYGIPFNVNYIDPAHTPVNIKIGAVTLPTAQGVEVDTDTSFTRDCGNITIPALGDFRDFEPYTQIEVYLPFCGTVKLDAAQVVGRTLNVVYFYDILTLACTACIYRDDDMLIATANGDIGAHLPLSASRMGDYQNAMKSTENALNQNAVRAGLGIISAGVSIGAIAAAPVTGGTSLALAGAALAGAGTAVNGLSNAEQLQYDLEHKQPNISQCSSPSGMVSMWIAQLKPWLFIKRAEMLPDYNPTVYGKTIGYACCINTTVGANSGLIVCSNVDTTGIPATADEINAIKQTLANGVIV